MMGITKIFIGMIAVLVTAVALIVITISIKKTGWGEILDVPMIDLIWGAAVGLIMLSVMKIVVNNRFFTWPFVWSFVGFVFVLDVLQLALGMSDEEEFYGVVIAFVLGGCFKTFRKKPSEEEYDSWEYYSKILGQFTALYGTVSVLIVLVSALR